MTEDTVDRVLLGANKAWLQDVANLIGVEHFWVEQRAHLICMTEEMSYRLKNWGAGYVPGDNYVVILKDMDSGPCTAYWVLSRDQDGGYHDHESGEGLHELIPYMTPRQIAQTYTLLEENKEKLHEYNGE
jgi:hypothetical protein